jgi:hypothetical protein
MLGFHARGCEQLLATIASRPDLIEQRRLQMRARIEALLAERQDEFASVGFYGKQAILKEIHKRAEREFSLSHCLF